MTMSERAAHLVRRLGEVHEMKDNVVEAGALSQLQSELAPLAQKFALSNGRVSVLLDAGIRLSLPASLVRFQQKAAKLRSDFTNEPRSPTLKRGQMWVSMMSDGETAVQELTTATKSAWQAHRTNLYAGKAPGVLNSELAKTTENQITLREYGEVFDQFRSLFDTVPTTSEVIDRAKTLANRLEIIATKFDFQVAAPIKAFLDAVQTVQGAQLILLTDEVVQWLRESKTLNGYCIKAVDRP